MRKIFGMSVAFTMFAVAQGSSLAIAQEVQTLVIDDSTITLQLPPGSQPSLSVVYSDWPTIGKPTGSGDPFLSMIGRIANTYGQNYQQSQAVEKAKEIARDTFREDPGRRTVGVLLERWVTQAPYSVFAATEYQATRLNGDSPDEIVYNAVRPDAEIKEQKTGKFAGFEIVTYDRDLNEYHVPRSHFETVYRDAQNPAYQQEMTNRRQADAESSTQRAAQERAKRDAEDQAKAAADAKSKQESEKRAADAAANIKRIDDERRRRKEEEDRRDAEANRMRALREKAQRSAISPSELKDYTRMVETAERIYNTAMVRKCDVDDPGPCSDNVVCPVCSSIDSYRSSDFAGNFKLMRNDRAAVKQLDIFAFGEAEPIGAIKLGPSVNLSKFPSGKFLDLSPFPRQ